MTTGDEITVHSCKHDGSVHRRWGARVTEIKDPLIVLEAVFDAEIRHPLLGTISRGTRSTEFFWTDRWYNVFRFREPAGELRNFYANVCTPARLSEGVLSFVDLDVDVLVAPDFSYRILDEDEFELHAEKYLYPLAYRENVRSAVEEIITLLRQRAFPFAAETVET